MMTATAIPPIDSSSATLKHDSLIELDPQSLAAVTGGDGKGDGKGAGKGGGRGGGLRGKLGRGLAIGALRLLGVGTGHGGGTDAPRPNLPPVGDLPIAGAPPNPPEEPPLVDLGGFSVLTPGL